MTRTRLRVLLALTVALVVAIIADGLAFAAPAGQSAPGESNLIYLLVGMLVVWVGFFGYAFYLSRKNREMRHELDELRERLAERERD